MLGLEQFEIPHTRGSSHGESRLIRLAYYEHPDYVPLLKRAYALWRELERETAAALLHVTGGVYLAPAGHELVEGSLRSAKTHGLPHELWTPAELRRRYPQFELPADHAVFYEPEAGFLLPESAVTAHAELARRHGADLHTQEPALDWKAVTGGLEVRTEKGVYRGRNLVITAGAWCGGLLPILQDKIRVTRQVMLWFAPRQPEAFELARFPCWCAASPRGGLVYGPPMLPAGAGKAGSKKPRGLKVSHHFPGIQTTTDTVHRDPLPGDEDAVREILRTHLPAADGEPVRHCVCLYSNSPDQHFVIDRYPAHANVFFAAGFSGHGFKFSSVIGEILADLATQGRTAHPIDFLCLSRLA